MRVVVRSLFFVFLISPWLSFAANQQVVVKRQVNLPERMGVLKTLEVRSSGALPINVHAVILKRGLYQSQLYLQPAASIDWVNEVVKQQKAVVGINAGYFMENFKPNGLLMIAGKRRSAMKYNRLLSALVLVNQQKEVDLKTRSQGYQGAYSALQVGPILVANGKVAVKPNLRYHRRTVLAKAANGDLIILQSSASNLYRLADLLTQHAAIFGAEKITFAVNCDGGSSSALMINDKNKPVYLSEATPVKTMLLFKGVS
ncbi:phosphodiester glycosidase family protein [Piscirickettsia litoralis]|uniref:Phosphodiester glycosidase domain-containing protein n=1 Tax=Piscirickettsia litoralis TaxID=1891921 RepID=A0ABX3A3N4_9GAMM|nr:phosphodiester glycosidase family protein [Piscirickettsia litoralis]ODN43068.1 hypothetical protein BGC07_09265 [Piscirickettsia litoralis]